VGRLWHATAGLDELVTGRLCARLHELALLSVTPTADGAVIGMHDVVRDYLRGQLDMTRQAALHGALLDAVAEDLPAAAPLDRDSAVAAVAAVAATAWWELGEQARYLWEHLIEHLLAADRTAAADTLAGDLRWIAARLAAFGPGAPAADLPLLDPPRAARLRITFARAAHLLGPTEPAHAQLDVLCSRVAHDPEWGPQARALAGQQRHPRLINRWPLPDLPDPALRRTLTSQTDLVRAVAVAPDGP